jgi:hypothetical protein
MLAIIFVPAYLYRWPLKSTALIWSPLLWVAGNIAEVSDLPRFVKNVVTLTSYKASRLYSGVIIIVFGAKIWLYVAFSQIEGVLNSTPGWQVLQFYILPKEIPGWQIAAVANSILAIFIFFQAERHVPDLQGGVKEISALQRRFRTLLAARNFLTIYTIFCSLYITCDIAAHSTLPRLRIFPWEP